MKRTGILFAGLLIVTICIFSSCKKNKEIQATIKENGLLGNWQLFFKIGMISFTNQDSLDLVNSGLMCNLHFDTKRKITVYSGDDQLNEVAEWLITGVETNGGQTVYDSWIRITVKQLKPDKSNNTYNYSINQDEFHDDVYWFTPGEFNESVFINNIKITTNDEGFYYFRKK
jgi:hypothetical protein